MRCCTHGVPCSSRVWRKTCKPIFPQQTTPTPAPAATFSVQTPASAPPLPARQPCPLPLAASPPSIPRFSPNPSSLFRSRARPEGCAFCLQPGHHVRLIFCQCSIAQEYMRLGHTLVLGNRLCLPKGQQILNDGTGHGLRHGIDTWLAAQAQVAPTPAHHVTLDLRARGTSPSCSYEPRQSRAICPHRRCNRSPSHQQ